RRQEVSTCIDEEDADGLAGTQPEELLGAICAEHPCADDHRIEREAAVRLRRVDLRPGVAHVPAEDVVAEGGVLDVEGGGGRGGNEERKRHDRLPASARDAPKDRGRLRRQMRPSSSLCDGRSSAKGCRERWRWKAPVANCR